MMRLQLSQRRSRAASYKETDVKTKEEHKMSDAWIGFLVAVSAIGILAAAWCLHLKMIGYALEDVKKGVEA